ncbi:MAG: hypothetical protein RL653_2162 [Pseudomonadota bacterium]|jgi:hypothetical protein
MNPVRLWRDGQGLLGAEWGEGQRREGLVPVRCFPLSAAEGWISLGDREGREVLLLETLEGLEAAGRELLLGELSRREFMPVIQQVLEIHPEDADPSEWRVITDRGEARFTLPGEDNVRPVGRGGYVLSDSHGIRYRVLDLSKLDTHSRRLLSRFCP